MTRRRQANRASFWTVLAPALALLLLCAGYLWLLGGARPSGPATTGESWTLTRQDGQLVTDRSFHGRFMLIYFGYTSCPDICPATLAAVNSAMVTLGARADRLQSVFVTIDPAHDTPATLNRYLKNVSPGTIGLTGTLAQVRAIMASFGIEVSHGSQAMRGDMINHTSVLLLIGPKGELLVPLPVTDDAGHLAKRLGAYL